MTKYIDKDAVIAEIERRIDVHHNLGHWNAEQEFLKVKKFLDSLEVKEVDLDLGSPDGDMGVKTVWDGDKIISSKAQKGE